MGLRAGAEPTAAAGGAGGGRSRGNFGGGGGGGGGAASGAAAMAALQPVPLGEEADAPRSNGSWLRRVGWCLFGMGLVALLLLRSTQARELIGSALERAGIRAALERAGVAAGIARPFAKIPIDIGPNGTPQWRATDGRQAPIPSLRQWMPHQMPHQSAAANPAANSAANSAGFGRARRGDFGGEGASTATCSSFQPMEGGLRMGGGGGVGWGSSPRTRRCADDDDGDADLDPPDLEGDNLTVELDAQSHAQSQQSPRTLPHAARRQSPNGGPHGKSRGGSRRATPRDLGSLRPFGEDELRAGAVCYYREPNGELSTVRVVKVHYDEPPPYYTIAFEGGVERSTVLDKLSRMHGAHGEEEGGGEGYGDEGDEGDDGDDGDAGEGSSVSNVISNVSVQLANARKLARRVQDAARGAMQNLASLSPRVNLEEATGSAPEAGEAGEAGEAEAGEDITVVLAESPNSYRDLTDLGRVDQSRDPRRYGTGTDEEEDGEGAATEVLSSFE